MVIHIADRNVQAEDIRSVSVEVDAVQDKGRTMYAVRVYMVDGTSAKHGAYPAREEAVQVRDTIAADLIRRGVHLSS
jgi:hypothetical protein